MMMKSKVHFSNPSKAEQQECPPICILTWNVIGDNTNRDGGVPIGEININEVSVGKES